MAFRLKATESVSAGVKRLVRRQVNNALDGLRRGAARDEVVHDVRKRFKKVRALLRLIRDEIGETVFRRENNTFRDAGRPLTEIRDAMVLIESLDLLKQHFAAEVRPSAFDSVRKLLQANRRAVRKRLLQDTDAIARVKTMLMEARERLAKWKIAHDGWTAFRRGLRRVYESGYRAMAIAARKPSTENLHEWRKQAKYLWHDLQVLEPVWPGVMKELAEQAHDLTQLLGDDHDLSVLRETVTSNRERAGPEEVIEALFGLIDRRRAELQREAFMLGKRLYLTKPKAFTDQIKGYWKVWRLENKSAGEA